MNTLLHLLANSVVVITAIGIHYEVLHTLYRGLPQLPMRPRARVLAGVIGAIIAHVLEIFVFAFGYMITENWGFGRLTGDFDGRIGDYVYFSFAAFTTVGYGDIVPADGMRWLAGIESLAGFVLITWTASFLYLEMLRNWKQH